MSEPLLQARGLSKRFVEGEPLVVDNVSFTVDAGEILVLLGPSGCGKTTTLRLLAGFERPDAGEVIHAGRVLLRATPPGACFLPPERRGIGFVFQDYALFPHLSVLANVAFGVRGPRAERRQCALDALRAVGLEGLARRRPHALSGGQQQRVALARSLAPTPSVILLDEPFSNLDAALRESARQEVRRLLHERRLAAVLVTHDQEEALALADRIAVMNAGRIEQLGPPEEIYLRPATPFCASFVGQTNLLTVTARGLAADSLLGELPLDRAAYGPHLAAVRPEDIVLAPPTPDATLGVVLACEFRGAARLYRLQVGGQVVVARTAGRDAYAIGEPAAVRVVGAAAVVGPAE